MHGRAAICLASALCALIALLSAPPAGAAAPAPLTTVSPGTPVRVAAGYVVTPRTAARRTASGWTIARADVRVGRSVRGEDVRVTIAPDGAVALRGGRFRLPREITARELSIAGAARIEGGTVTGTLQPRPGLRRRDGTVAPQVGSALPAAPAGRQWSLTGELTAEGLHIGLLLGPDEVGTVLIRFDGSYRVALTLRDLDVFGSPVTISGEVSGSSILDLSSIRLRGTITGRLQLAAGVELREATVIWDRDGFVVAGTVAVACPAGGELTARASLTLGTDLQNWSAGATLRAGAKGCGLADDLALDPGTEIAATITSTAGRIALAVDATVALRTTLIPTQSAFTVGLRIRADGASLEIGLSGSADGARFTGEVHRDGTFLIEFVLTDLDLAGTKISASGRVSRATPDGEIRVTVGGGTDRPLWLVPNLLSLQSADLGWDPVSGRITVAATLRLVCTTGTLDLGAGGTVSPSGRIVLTVAGDADRCTVADALTLDGKTLAGTITLDGDKPPLIDFALQIAKVRLGDLASPPAEGIAAEASDIAARISNTCAACKNGAALSISFSGSFQLAGRTPPLPFLRIGVTISGGVLMEGDVMRGLALRLTGLTLFGAPSSLSVVLEAELIRTFEAALGLPPGSITLIPAEPVPTYTEGADAPRGRVVAVAATLDRCLASATCRPRLGVTVRTTGRGAVAVQLERRSCRAGRCGWTRLTRTTLIPDERYVARARASRQLSAGTYRVVVTPAARSGATMRRTFRVLAAR